MTQPQPKPFILREASAADAKGVAEVQTATWKVAYAGQMPADYLAALSAAEREPVWRASIESRKFRVVLAEREGSIVGFSAYGKSRDADAGSGAVGEVSAIYLREQFWNTGAGTVLLRASEEALRADGFSELTLWVLDTNTRARNFYERRGYLSDGAEKTETLRSKIVDQEIRELRYRKGL